MGGIQHQFGVFSRFVANPPRNDDPELNTQVNEICGKPNWIYAF
jgi:hypothetical protein